MNIPSRLKTLWTANIQPGALAEEDHGAVFHKKDKGYSVAGRVCRDEYLSSPRNLECLMSILNLSIISTLRVFFSLFLCTNQISVFKRYKKSIICAVTHKHIYVIFLFFFVSGLLGNVHMYISFYLIHIK